VKIYHFIIYKTTTIFLQNIIFTAYIQNLQIMLMSDRV